MAEGFEPFFAQQYKTRVEGKEAFTKHMVRVRHASRVTSGDEAKKEIFVEQVKAVVTSISGPAQDLSLRITPRGRSFTKVKIQANVESAAMIASIYKEFEQLEMSVMQF